MIDCIKFVNEDALQGQIIHVIFFVGLVLFRHPVQRFILPHLSNSNFFAPFSILIHPSTVFFIAGHIHLLSEREKTSKKESQQEKTKSNKGGDSRRQRKGVRKYGKAKKSIPQQDRIAHAKILHV